MCGFHNFIFFNHDWQNVYCYYNHILYFLFLYKRTNLTMLWKNTHFFHYVEIRYFLMWLLITKLIVMKLFSKIDIMCPLALFSSAVCPVIQWRLLVIVCSLLWSKTIIVFLCIHFPYFAFCLFNQRIMYRKQVLCDTNEYDFCDRSMTAMIFMFSGFFCFLIICCVIIYLCFFIKTLYLQRILCFVLLVYFMLFILYVLFVILSCC